MTSIVEKEAIPIEASDATGQKTVRVAGLSPDMTIGELVRGLIPKMSLPENDLEGRPLTYHARLERSGSHLHGSAVAREVLQPGDRISLQPNIMAGAC